MSCPAPLLEARHVSKRFGPSIIALDGVDLTVSAGDWLAITGPSGSGKTSLLQLFAALETPTAGQVLYQGQDLRSLADLNAYRRSRVGIVFQLHNLLPHLDVRGNIEIVMLGAGRSRRQRVEQVNRLVHDMNLETQQFRMPPELSGGERQRVAIARALVNDPEILLADEPTGSLDRDHVQRLLDLVHRLHDDRGVAIVMVTHDVDVAARAQRVVLLDCGRIVEPLAGSSVGTLSKVDPE